MSILCISLAVQPGRFGTIVHNAGYQALGLDYLYKAFATNDLASALGSVRALNIRGCSISMPFKETVMNYLDSIDEEAAIVGAVNTIVNDKGHLKGFNTDVNGALMSLKPYLKKETERIMVLGAGGVARAILHALNLLGQKNIILCVRNADKHFNLAKQFGVQLVDWSFRHKYDVEILINATPIGMTPHDGSLPIDIHRLPSLHLVMDVVSMPVATALIKKTRENHLQAIDGLTMALYQAYEQFYLYTGVLAPREAMRKAAKTLLLTQ